MSSTGSQWRSTVCIFVHSNSLILLAIPSCLMPLCFYYPPFHPPGQCTMDFQDTALHISNIPLKYISLCPYAHCSDVNVFFSIYGIYLGLFIGLAYIIIGYVLRSGSSPLASVGKCRRHNPCRTWDLCWQQGQRVECLL